MLILLIRTFLSSVETDLSHLKLTSFTSVMFHETLEHKLWIFGPRHHKCTQRNRKDDLVWEEEALTLTLATSSTRKAKTKTVLSQHVSF